MIWLCGLPCRQCVPVQCLVFRVTELVLTIKYYINYVYYIHILYSTLTEQLSESRDQSILHVAALAAAVQSDRVMSISVHHTHGRFPA